jgi:small subunit ribosomal protein S5
MGLNEKLYLQRVSIDEAGDLREKTVNVSRVSKVVKGGRRFSFSALVVSGDGMGHIGFGHGKAGEVPDAVRKATEGARKSLIKVILRGSSVPHEVVGKFGATTVIVKPAAPGTGVIAGSVVRAVVELIGIKDIRTKIIGSSNPYNVLYATMDALTKMREPETVAQLRGQTLEELGYAAY